MPVDDQDAAAGALLDYVRHMRNTRSTDDQIAEVQRRLDTPRVGHAGHVPGTFEWVVPRLPYIVVYEVDEPAQQVIVIAVFHGAQSRED